MTKLKAVSAFKKGNTAAPGTMLWAEAMGEFYAHSKGKPFKSRSHCEIATYRAPNDVGERQLQYTKDQLYFIAKGMGLKATRRMSKTDLCQLITTGTPAVRQAPF